MNRTLFALLIILNIIVLVLSSWTLYRHQQDREIWLQHMSSMQVKMEKQSEQIETQVNSIGERAAETMKGLSGLSADTVNAMKPKLERTVEELRKTGDEMTALFNSNAQKAAEELKIMGQQILARINDELQNFNENMRKENPPKQ